mgnify:FL=1|tara:strand:+ start:338 stop:553 length:216 start_codon:yes stop_codon:yes gene_type:complete
MKSYNYQSLNEFLSQTDFVWHLRNDIQSAITEEAEKDGEIADFDKPFYSQKLEAETKSRILDAFAQYGINL